MLHAELSRYTANNLTAISMANMNRRVPGTQLDKVEQSFDLFRPFFGVPELFGSRCPGGPKNSGPKENRNAKNLTDQKIFGLKSFSNEISNQGLITNLWVTVFTSFRNQGDPIF